MGMAQHEKKGVTELIISMTPPRSLAFAIMNPAADCFATLAVTG
jgi:hypothetical protein